MLGMGLFLAGIAVGVVLLEFERLDSVGQNVAIGGLVILSGTAMWAFVQIRRSRGEPDVAHSPPDARGSAVGRQQMADGRQESQLGNREPSPGQVGRTASPNAANAEDREKERAAAGHESKEVQPSGERNDPREDPSDPKSPFAIEPEGESVVVSSPATGASPPEGVESRRHAPDPLAMREAVVRAWRQYLKEGDGHFNASGFRAQLEVSGLELSVKDGDMVQAGDTLLLVEDPSDEGNRFLAVPNFTKAPGAAPKWFDDVGDGALGRRAKRIHALAEGEWTEAGFKVIEKGSIE